MRVRRSVAAAVAVAAGFWLTTGCDSGGAEAADQVGKPQPPPLADLAKSDSADVVIEHERAELNTVVEAELEASAWVHAWPVVFSGPATLKLETFPDVDVDTVLAVQAWDDAVGSWGPVIAENDDNPDDVSGASLLWVDVDAGRYQITVRGYPELSAEGGFALEIRCDGDGCVVPTEVPAPVPDATPVVASLEGHPAHGLSADFSAFLDAAGYDRAALARQDVAGGSFGGRVDAAQALTRQPVIFVHGNADRALGGPLGGWSVSVEAFLAAGYTSAELYATTWGPADASSAALQYHSREHLTQVRRFIEAVLEYTGAAKVDVIGHSMGVTLARKAIEGGSGSDALAGGDYELGDALTDRVDTFVGIAGANQGLTACWVTGPTTPTCGATNGFYPGQATFWGSVVGRSAFLTALNERERTEGDHIYSIWSRDDELVGSGGIVWGSATSAIAGEDGSVVLDGGEGHLETKSLTAGVQLGLVTEQRIADR